MTALAGLRHALTPRSKGQRIGQVGQSGYYKRGSAWLLFLAIFDDVSVV